MALAQPPLPEGKEASQGELPGTTEWVGLREYRESSRRGELVWVDMKQGEGQEGEYENFWPELGRWRLGIKLERGEAAFGVGERWEGPRYGL